MESHHDFISLFEHDLRANAFAFVAWKTGFHFSGSCSKSRSNDQVAAGFLPFGFAAFGGCTTGSVPRSIEVKRPEVNV